jgi:ubiquinone/menaquinone biosynthesis C-methylase UbiE
VALFDILVGRSEITPNLDILDIGSGCGDSTLLLSRMKPKSLCGVTSQATQSMISRQRFPKIQFVHADAVEYISSLPSETVDRIFALDCVYHFSSRSRFLKESTRILRNNGKIALTDLILGQTTLLQRLIMRIICFLTSSPYSNFQTMDEYRLELSRTGLTDISIEDISTDVFPGLRDFIWRHYTTMGSFGISGSWMGYLVFARILDWWSTGVVRFIAVHASKSIPP